MWWPSRQGGRPGSDIASRAPCQLMIAWDLWHRVADATMITPPSLARTMLLTCTFAMTASQRPYTGHLHTAKAGSSPPSYRKGLRGQMRVVNKPRDGTPLAGAYALSRSIGNACAIRGRCRRRRERGTSAYGGFGAALRPLRRQRGSRVHEPTGELELREASAGGC